MKELVRGLGGLITILTLNALVAADVLLPRASLSLQQVQVLVVLVGALLGLDIMLDKIPVSIELGSSSDTESNGGDSYD